MYTAHQGFQAVAIILYKVQSGIVTSDESIRFIDR